jgi:hypothetical protein
LEWKGRLARMDHGRVVRKISTVNRKEGE